MNAQVLPASKADEPPGFALSDVSFSIGGRALLSGVSLDLPGGRIYGLVGPNGSGKSTLMKIMARQQRPASGIALFGGRNISTLSDRSFARSVAYMPQFTPPADGMTVAELVALGRFPWHGALGRFGPEDAAKVDDALADTGLTGMRDRLVDTLSGGERQRAWLAMMLAQDARFLLLDEPTSALDVAHQVEMLDLVRRLSQTHGIGALVVLHDINMAARLCDEIVALGGGRIVAKGAPSQVMTGAVLERIYGIGMDVVPHPGTGKPIGYVR
jgi:iron complex transport system ATP-binding protein